jgi:hypothetical protein
MTSRRYLINLVFLVFFVMSILTNILGPIVPDIIAAFHVSMGAEASSLSPSSSPTVSSLSRPGSWCNALVKKR